MQYKLKEARQNAKLSQAEVANKIGTTQQQMNKYENEQQEMTLQRAVQLADLYNVSLDYLAGRTNRKEVNK